MSLNTCDAFLLCTLGVNTVDSTSALGFKLIAKYSVHLIADHINPYGSTVCFLKHHNGKLKTAINPIYFHIGTYILKCNECSFADSAFAWSRNLMYKQKVRVLFLSNAAVTCSL